jgi:type II secretory pathway predicted ATPase ExeA
VYLDYWGMTTKPFENVAHPAFFYLSPQHEEALLRLLYAVKERKGAALLTGEYGCGKTTVSRTLVEMARQQLGLTKIALLNYPRISSDEFLWKIIRQLGPSLAIPEMRVQKLELIEELLTEEHQKGRHTVIIVDEAHLIENLAIFEELRLLLNFQRDEKFMLTLILIGQPELRKKIDQIPAFKQRVAILYHLEVLSREEMEKYILFRIEHAGGNPGILADREPLDYLYAHIGGAPRAINNVCDAALLAGFINKENKISLETMKAVVDDFEKGV